MDNLINLLEEIPLTGCDLVSQASKLGNPNTVFIDDYDTLKHMISLEDLFGGANSVFILLDIFSERDPMAQIGHWVMFMSRRRKLHTIF